MGKNARSISTATARMLMKIAKKIMPISYVYGCKFAEEQRIMEEKVKDWLKFYSNFNKHKKQIEFHENQSCNKWIFGGNRTGKTECGAVEAVMWATGEHKWRDIKGATEGWVVSLTTRMSRDIAQAKILKYLPKDRIIEIVMQKGRKGAPEYGIVDFILVANKFGTTSKIIFKTCEQGRERFQGASLDYIWFDEEPPEDIYQECLMRTLDRAGSCIWATMTPLKGKTWVYDKIYLSHNASVSYSFMSWEDNPYLLPAEIKKMQASLSADVLESRKYGRFMEGTGLVFAEFCETENVIEPFEIPRIWCTCVSIDPGFTNPCAVLWLAVDNDDNIYVVADYSVAEKQVDYHAREILKISDNLGFQKDSHGYLPAIIDSAALSHTLGNPGSVAEQFVKHGIRVDARVEKGIISGIMKIKSLLKNVDGYRKLFIFKNCVNLIREIKDYWWGNNERPVKSDDHCIDALRYFVSTVYENKNHRARITAQSSPVKNILGKAKQKFIREAKLK